MNKKINGALLIIALIGVCMMPALTAYGASGSNAATSGTDQGEPVEITVNLAYTLDRLEKTYDMFKQLVEERSKGHIKINRLATGSMGTVNEVIEALQQGTIHISSIGSMELGSASPSSDWIQLPYLFKDFDQVNELYVNGWIGKELAKEYE
jgi:TRAP-type C4-dicarboxylate transport system substrate-binding protein